MWKVLWFFSIFFTDLLAKLNITKRKTIIFECEFFAIFVAMRCWTEQLRSCQVVVCTDNEGVKDSLIAYQTSSANAIPLLCAILQLEFDLRWNAWCINTTLIWITCGTTPGLATRGGFYQQSVSHAEKTESVAKTVTVNLKKQSGKSVT